MFNALRGGADAGIVIDRLFGISDDVPNIVEEWHMIECHTPLK
jgi:hypothetical protein